MEGGEDGVSAGVDDIGFTTQRLECVQTLV
jgi:hypothetical protein